MNKKIIYSEIKSMPNAIAFVNKDFWDLHHFIKDQKDKYIFEVIFEFQPKELYENIYEFDNIKAILNSLRNNSDFYTDENFSTFINNVYK